jgi:hypothetical protein
MNRLKQKRIVARIPGRMLCPIAQITPARLSDIERGYSTPTAEETARIWKALEALIVAEEKVREFARTVGWPME